MRHCTTILLALALAACGCNKNTKADEPTSESKFDETAPVTLTFDWATGLEGTLERANTEQTGSEPAERSSVVYTVSTQPADDGVQLTYSDPRDAKVDGATPEQLAAIAPMFHAVPTVVIRDGAVVSIDNVEMMRMVVDQLAPIPDDAPADVKARMEATRSEQFFLQAAQAEWATLTTVWHGKTLEPKKTMQARTKTQLLGLPSEIETVISMTLEEWLPCPRTQDKRCVRLTYSSTPDPASLQEASKSISQEAARNGVKFEIESLTREFKAELVTDPTTLLPYEFESNELTELAAKQNGQPTSMKQLKQRSESYDWNAD